MISAWWLFLIVPAALYIGYVIGILIDLKDELPTDGEL